MRVTKPTLDFFLNIHKLITYRAYALRDLFHGMEYQTLEFYDVVFLADYLKWKAGDKVYTLVVDGYTNRVVALNQNEYIVQEANMTS